MKVTRVKSERVAEVEKTMMKIEEVKRKLVIPGPRVKTEAESHSCF
jgi:hypothetical protein